MDRGDVIEFVDRVQVLGLGYLVLLYLLHGATVSELTLITRQERHTISGVLRALESRGLALRAQAGRSDRWQISVAGLRRLEFDGGITTNNAPTTATALLADPKKSAAEAAARLDGGKTTINAARKLNPARVAALRAAGVGTNLHAELCGYKWCTPAYIKAHDEYRRAQGESVGLLITRLRCHDEPPEVRSMFGTSAARDWADLLKARDQWAADRARNVARKKNKRG